MTHSIIITDDGFAQEDWTQAFVTPEDLAANDAAPVVAVDLTSEIEPGNPLDM